MSAEAKSRETQDLQEIDIEGLQAKLSSKVSGGSLVLLAALATLAARGASSLLALSVVGIVFGVSGVLLPAIIHRLKNEAQPDDIENTLKRLSKVEGVSEQDINDLRIVLIDGQNRDLQKKLHGSKE